MGRSLRAAIESTDEGTNQTHLENSARVIICIRQRLPFMSGRGLAPELPSRHTYSGRILWRFRVCYRRTRMQLAIAGYVGGILVHKPVSLPLGCAGAARASLCHAHR